jgi:hypothetical protein
VKRADDVLIGLGRRKGRVKSRGTSSPLGCALSLLADMTAAEWVALRSASTV